MRINTQNEDRDKFKYFIHHARKNLINMDTDSESSDKSLDSECSHEGYEFMESPKK